MKDKYNELLDSQIAQTETPTQSKPKGAFDKNALMKQQNYKLLMQRKE